MYWESIDSIIQSDLGLIDLLMPYKISWKAFSRPNWWFITVFVVELKKPGENSISVVLYSINKILIVILYLKLFVSSKRSLNKSLMLDLLVSDCDERYYLSINSTLHVVAYPLNASFVFTTLNSSQKRISTSLWPYTPDHPYRMLIIGDSGSGKTNGLINLIKEQDSDSLIDKIDLYSQDLSKLKYQFLIKKAWKCRNKTFKWSKIIYKIFTMYGWCL